MKKIKITIGGMHCSGCAANVERIVKKIKGVKDVSVSLMINKCFIEMETETSIGDIKKAIEKLGYKVVNIEE